MSKDKPTISIRDEMEGEPSLKELEIEEKPLWQRIIFADSSPKPLNSYDTHPLNFDKKESTGRIIKGFEGMIGSLDKAIVDIIVGLIQKVSELAKSSKKVVD